MIAGQHVVSVWGVRHIVVFFGLSIACQAQYFPLQALASDDPKSVSHFYDLDRVQTIRLTVSAEELERMRSALPKRIYVPARFQCGNWVVENVGIRYKGNSSSNPRQPYKRSFLIKFNEFNEGDSFLGLERVALDNGIQFGSLFSEPLITSILRELKVVAPRCNYVRLYLNDRFHGVYVNVERIDETFIASHFRKPSGALYKVDEGGAGANLAPIPQGARARLGFEAKSPAALAKATDVLELIRRINQTPNAEFPDVLERTLDVDAFLKTMAVMLFSGAFDQLTGWNPHNYYLYHDPSVDRWHYLPWDLDVGFADKAFGRIPVLDGWNAAWPIAGGAPRPLLERIVDDPELLRRYRKHANDILNRHFHPQVLIPKLESCYALIQPDLEKDPFPRRRVTNPRDTGYASILDSQKDFMKKRYLAARAQLDNPGARPKRAPETRKEQPKPGNSLEDAPSQLRATARTAKEIVLQWKDNAEGEVAHIVQRATGKASQSFRNHIGKPGGHVEEAHDTGVQPGQTYRYRVYAIRPSPQGPVGSGVSNTITVRVPEE